MKTKVYRSYLIVFLIFMTTNFIYSQTLDELKMKIQKINNEMAQAMVSGNSEKSLSYYANDAISMPNNAPMVEGIDAIRKSNQEMMQSGMQIKSFEFTTKKVKLCDSMITEIGTYKGSFMMPNMQQPVEDQGKYLTIWEKQADGSLKIKIEIWNADTRPM